VLLTLTLTLAACSKGKQAKAEAKTEAKARTDPDGKPLVPRSVSPGWKLTSLVHSGAPRSVPPGPSPDCWEASYAGSGNALVWLCRYEDKARALHAFQTANTQAQIMIFQEGLYLVIVEWSAESISDFTALIHGVKETMNAPQSN
jgi:hypothetical protein